MDLSSSLQKLYGEKYNGDGNWLGIDKMKLRFLNASNGRQLILPSPFFPLRNNDYSLIENLTMAPQRQKVREREREKMKRTMCNEIPFQFSSGCSEHERTRY